MESVNLSPSMASGHLCWPGLTLSLASDSGHHVNSEISVADKGTHISSSQSRFFRGSPPSLSLYI